MYGKLEWKWAMGLWGPFPPFLWSYSRQRHTESLEYWVVLTSITDQWLEWMHQEQDFSSKCSFMTSSPFQPKGIPVYTVAGGECDVFRRLDLQPELYLFSAFGDNTHSRVSQCSSCQSYCRFSLFLWPFIRYYIPSLLIRLALIIEMRALAFLGLKHGTIPLGRPRQRSSPTEKTLVVLFQRLISKVCYEALSRGDHPRWLASPPRTNRENTCATGIYLAPELFGVMQCARKCEASANLPLEALSEDWSANTQYLDAF